MSIIQHTTKERDLLARLMRAEAIGEGDLGMLMVGNVVVNRGISNCLTFNNTRTITEVLYQNPGGFSGVNSPLFFSNPTTVEQNLADRVIRGEYYHPATTSGAACKSTWWDQDLSGRYKNHCFYTPAEGVCHELY